MYQSHNCFRKAFASKNTRKAIPYVMYFGKWYQTIVGTLSTADACVKNCPTWSKEGIVQGFRRIEEISKTKDQFVYQVYSKEEIKEDKMRKDAVVMHFKAKNHNKKPYVVIVPGGGYEVVCAVAEGFPTAALLNDLGYDAFVFNYRVNKKPLMPTPIDDLAKAIEFINNHAEEFDVEKDRYIVAGFSAGGNLINLFCSSKLGYQKYGLPKPIATFPVYAGCDFVDATDNPTMNAIFKKQFGEDYKEADLKDYLISNHCETFPPAYLVFCKDDDTVDPKESERLGLLLKEKGIPTEIEIGEKGAHGFGSGQGTSVENWVERAMNFAKQFM